MWAEVLALPVATFGSASSFFDFGGSLTFFKLSKAFETDAGVSVEVATLLQSPTLSAMAKLVFSGVGSAADAFDADAEARKYPLAPPFKAAYKLPTEAAAAVSAATLARHQALTSKVVLVTGCTGYLGAFVMEALARRPDVSSVVALARAADAEAAGRRLRTNCEKRGITESDDFPAWFSKVTPLAGDVGQVRFGLSEEAYALLACRADAIVHAAAEVNI